MAVVGLGNGSMACHGTVDQGFIFYEIDPAVERIAREARLFTYLKDCPPTVEVILGDARLTLKREADGHFGLIVLDAFSSDSIPLHFITREAIKLY